MISKVNTAFWYGFIKAAADSVGVQVQHAPRMEMQTNQALQRQAPVAAPPTSRSTPVVPAPDIYSRIKNNEGFRPNTYTNTTGHATATIGYGSTNPQLVNQGHVSESTAASELTNHVNQVTGSVSNILGSNIWNRTPQPIKDSLVDLGYQTGSLNKWPRLMDSIRHNDYTNAVTELRNSRINAQTPNRNDQRVSLIQDWLRTNQNGQTRP